MISTWVREEKGDGRKEGEFGGGSKEKGEGGSDAHNLPPREDFDLERRVSSGAEGGRSARGSPERAGPLF